jgi:hypothetical protein
MPLVSKWPATFELNGFLFNLPERTTVCSVVICSRALRVWKSVSEIIKLSAGQARKNFDVASAQNMELWGLAQKVATETAEPVKKSVTRVLQKVI